MNPPSQPLSILAPWFICLDCTCLPLFQPLSLLVHHLTRVDQSPPLSVPAPWFIRLDCTRPLLFPPLSLLVHHLTRHPLSILAPSSIHLDCTRLPLLPVQLLQHHHPLILLIRDQQDQLNHHLMESCDISLSI